MMPERLDLIIDVAGQRYEVMVAADPVADELGSSPYAVGIATEVKPMPGALARMC
jgi:hypothetical protein